MWINHCLIYKSINRKYNFISHYRAICHISQLDSHLKKTAWMSMFSKGFRWIILAVESQPMNVLSIQYAQVYVSIFQFCCSMNTSRRKNQLAKCKSFYREVQWVFTVSLAPFRTLKILAISTNFIFSFKWPLVSHVCFSVVMYC